MASNKTLVTIIWEETMEDGTKREFTYPLPNPATYNGSTSTMVDSGTSVSGKLLGAVIRNDVAQISLSWNYLDAKEWKEINQQFKRQYINRVSFFDQTAGDWIERDMYISNRSAGMWRHDPDGNVLGWTGCGLQLTEV